MWPEPFLNSAFLQLSAGAKDLYYGTGDVLISLTYESCVVNLSTGGSVKLDYTYEAWRV